MHLAIPTYVLIAIGLTPDFGTIAPGVATESQEIGIEVRGSTLSTAMDRPLIQRERENAALAIFERRYQNPQQSMLL